MTHPALPTDRPHPRQRPGIRAVVRVPLTLTDGCCATSEIISFHGLEDNREHFAVKLGVPSGTSPLVRLHSECVTGDVFGSARCDCGSQLNEAVQRLAAQGGYVLYLRQEGRGIGLLRKLDAYVLQDRGYDTYGANRALGHRDDERDYTVAADMLRALDIPRITLLSNNPDKRSQLIQAGIEVDAQVTTGVFLNLHNRQYLTAKVQLAHHAMDLGTATETLK